MIDEKPQRFLYVIGGPSYADSQAVASSIMGAFDEANDIASYELNEQSIWEEAVCGVYRCAQLTPEERRNEVGYVSAHYHVAHLCLVVCPGFHDLISIDHAECARVRDMKTYLRRSFPMCWIHTTDSSDETSAVIDLFEQLLVKASS